METQNKNLPVSGNYEFFKQTAEINSYQSPPQIGGYTSINTQNDKLPPANWNTGVIGYKREVEKKEENNRSDDILKRIDAVLAQSRNQNFWWNIFIFNFKCFDYKSLLFMLAANEINTQDYQSTLSYYKDKVDSLAKERLAWLSKFDESSSKLQ